MAESVRCCAQHFLERWLLAIPAAEKFHNTVHQLRCMPVTERSKPQQSRPTCTAPPSSAPRRPRRRPTGAPSATAPSTRLRSARQPHVGAIRASQTAAAGAPPACLECHHITDIRSLLAPRFAQATPFPHRLAPAGRSCCSRPAAARPPGVGPRAAPSSTTAPCRRAGTRTRRARRSRRASPSPAARARRRVGRRGPCD